MIMWFYVFLGGKKSKGKSDQRSRKKKTVKGIICMRLQGSRWSSGGNRVWGRQANWLRTTGTEGQRLRGHRSDR